MPATLNGDTPIQGLEFSLGFNDESLRETAAQGQAVIDEQEKRNQDLIQNSEDLDSAHRIRMAEREDEDLKKFETTIKSRELLEIEKVDRLIEVNERYYKSLEDQRQFNENRIKLEKQRQDLEDRIESPEGEAGAGAAIAGQGRGALTALGLGGVLSIASLAGMVAALRSAREGVRALRLESLELIAISGGGGAGGMGAAKGLSGFASQIERDLQIDRSKTLGVAGILARGGFEQGGEQGFGARGGVTQQVLELERGTGTSAEDIASTFNMFRNELNISTGEMADAFKNVKATADALDVPFKTFAEQTINLSKQLEPFGFSLNDATEVVGEFIEDLERGAISMAQVARIATGGFSGAGEGELAFLAEQLMQPGALPEGIRAQLDQAGGPLGKIEFLRQAARGERGAEVRGAVGRAGAGVISGMAGDVAGADASPERLLNLQRRFFRMFGSDLPESAEAARRALDAMQNGFTITADKQDQISKLQEGYIETAKQYTEEHNSVINTLKIFGTQMFEGIMRGTDLTGTDADPEARAPLTPGQFHRAAQTTMARVRGGELGGDESRTIARMIGFASREAAAGGGDIGQFIGGATTTPGGTIVFPQLSFSVDGIGELSKFIRTELQGHVSAQMFPKIKNIMINMAKKANKERGGP